MDLSVVVPVFNEEQNLVELVKRTVAACSPLGRPYELILVDDGSRDRSPELIEKACAAHPEVRGVLLNRNYGQHAAIMAGFAEAKGDVVVTLDADLQNPPEEIPRLVAEADKGHDVVGTIRMARRDTWFRRTASKLVNTYVRKATGAVMQDYGCMLRAYRRPIVDAMLQCREGGRFIPVLANTFAADPIEIEVSHAERHAGDSKYGLWKLFNLYFDLMTCMSTAPLRVATFLGVVLFGLGLGVSGVLLLGRLFIGSDWAVSGVFTLFALEFALVGAQFLAIGLLGEYLGRVYQDVRARPPYLVKRKLP